MIDSNGKYLGTRTPSVSGAASSQAPQIVTIPTGAKITSLKVWKTTQPVNTQYSTNVWPVTQVEFVLSTGSSLVVTSPSYVPTTNAIMTAPLNTHIVGFHCG